MKERIIHALEDLGFTLEVLEGIGYTFTCEGIGYIWTIDEDDECFLSIAIPNVFDQDDIPEEYFYRLLNKINFSARYVKAVREWSSRSVYLFYERKLTDGDNLVELLQHVIGGLETVMIMACLLVKSENYGLEEDD